MTATQPDAAFHRRPEVFGGGPTVLLNNRGEPLPPTDVVERLAKTDERLSIEWVEGAWGIAYFGLFERWRRGDPRWQRVQSGEISEKQARDLVQMFPRSCPPAEMAAFVEARWGDRARAVDPRAEAERMVADAAQRGQGVREQGIAAVVDQSMAKFADESSHSLRVRAGTEAAHPMVAGHTFDEPKRLIESP